MKRYKSLLEETSPKEYFYYRTNRHIDLVKKYGSKLADILEKQTKKSFQNLRNNIEHHDQSKYKEPELTPYILITWNYYCKDNDKELNLSQEQKDEMNKATEHHVKTNKHHPEYWSNRTNVIPKSDRDSFNSKDIPIINIKKMPFIYLCEMICDWCAMGKERNNSPREWANKVLNKRYKFSDNQTNQIYKLIDLVWQ